jgi:hypothetical protein
MLTPAQLATLKTAILADSVLAAQPMNSDGAYAIALTLNELATPAFIVWKTNVSVEEIMRNGMDWARVDNLSVGKARIWDWLTKLGTFKNEGAKTFNPPGEKTNGNDWVLVLDDAAKKFTAPGVSQKM